MFVRVRKKDFDLVYYGKILFFSEISETKELVMQDVILYKDVGGKVDDGTAIQLVYVSANPNEISIEYPVVVPQTDCSCGNVFNVDVQDNESHISYSITATVNQVERR
ncbi:MAG: hypothetical protein LBR07_10530 [Puniceicoccales bacterium]|nr:hypothetical protein [Puniceicoccales bacterium]